MAKETRVELVDLNSLTDGKRELFGPDGLHPSAKGAKAIAEAIGRKIKADSNTIEEAAKHAGQTEEELVEKTGLSE